MIRFTEPCPQCENWCFPPCDKLRCTEAHRDPATCPSCVDGMVPDDATVKAAKLGAMFLDLPDSLTLDEKNNRKVRESLIAAARHQKDSE